MVGLPLGMNSNFNLLFSLVVHSDGRPSSHTLLTHQHAGNRRGPVEVLRIHRPPSTLRPKVLISFTESGVADTMLQGCTEGSSRPGPFGLLQVFSRYNGETHLKSRIITVYSRKDARPHVMLKILHMIKHPEIYKYV